MTGYAGECGVNACEVCRFSYYCSKNTHDCELIAILMQDVKKNITLEKMKGGYCQNCKHINNCNKFINSCITFTDEDAHNILKGYLIARSKNYDL